MGFDIKDYALIALFIALIGLSWYYNYQIDSLEDTVSDRDKEIVRLNQSIGTHMANETTLKSSIKAQNKRIEVLRSVHADKLEELEKWKTLRGWEDDLPRNDKDDRVGLAKYKSYLEDVCFDEAKKHFYKSKEGQKMQVVRLQREKAMDILHTDGHKEELLIALAKVCEAVKIPMNIPREALKITSK